MSLGGLQEVHCLIRKLLCDSLGWQSGDGCTTDDDGRRPREPNQSESPQILDSGDDNEDMQVRKISHIAMLLMEGL